MPKKTIYVADADLPLFERAATLAGGLSPAIATALRSYVAQHPQEEAVPASTPMETIELEVARGATLQRQRFRGHQIARVEQTRDLRTVTYRIFETAKGQYAVYTVDRPDWTRWSHDTALWNDPRTWTSDYYASRDRSLEIYPTQEAMLDDLPDDIAETVRTAITQPTTIDLDI